MEDLLASQYELHGRIARTWDNLKKTGQQNITIDHVRTTLSLLDSKWSRLEEQHTLLMRSHRAALKGHDYVTGDFVSQAESIYTTQRSQLLRLERQCTASSASDATRPAAPAQAAPAQSTSYPRIDLPKFTGKFEDWPAFRDLFTSMVIEESSLPQVRKLHYLKTSVLGEAESLLKNLPTTEENFQRAWDTLKAHFENKRLLVRSYLNALTTLPKMRPNAISDLRRIFHVAVSTIGALEGIGRPLTSSEDLAVHLIANLLDQSLRRDWEKSLSKTTKPPTLDELLTFLKEQLTSEEALAASQSDPPVKQTSRSGRNVRVAQLRSTQTNPGRPCPICKGDHFIAACGQYQRKAPQERKELAAAHSRCFNCLGRHSMSSCTSSKTCMKCNGRHHTTLHEAFAPSTNSNDVVSVHIARLPAAEPQPEVLATARVWVSDALGRQHLVRAVIDPGAERSLIRESLAQRLRLPRAPTSKGVRGVIEKQTSAMRGNVTVTISSLDKGFSFAATMLVFPRLSVYNGPQTDDINAWHHIHDLNMADPDLAARDPAVILLGSGAYGDIVMSGVRRGRKQDPVAQQTQLGWVLFGGHGDEESTPAVHAMVCTLDNDIASVLRRFWEWEEPVNASLPPTEEEQRGEEHFCKSFKRLPSGRFQVRLPFRTPPATQLVATRRAALRAFEAVERRFMHDEAFSRLYHEFMEEYIKLGHMSPAPMSLTHEGSGQCFLPHHGVLKSSGDMRKLRVVFNGSARTAAGTSLNEHLLTGPNLLPPLQDILLRWRRHRYAFVADIEKMYRQVLMHPDDRDYQRILWKQRSCVTEYRLNTLTYGTACAPFLAMRVLRQLAQEEEGTFPLGSTVLQQDVYVDDVLSGASTVEAGLQKQRELSALCMAGGFPLRKWAANHPGLLEGVPQSHRQAASPTAELPVKEHAVLGLRWRPSEDSLFIGFTTTPIKTPTRKAVLSQIARLFDPLGWLAPVITKAKILLQATWQQRLDWDGPLAGSEATTWHRLTEELVQVEELCIPRWFTGLEPDSDLQIHGFADASERACGAVVYLRTMLGGRVNVSLVQAKSKVAPLKQISLPRLELTAAALLSRVSAHVRDALGLKNVITYHWSDSTVTLAWIRGHPSRWNTYVANRVAEIQRDGHEVQWRHISGRENPADCLSRGLFPNELKQHPLWWQGPPFLMEGPSAWPNTEESLPDENLPEKRPIKCLTTRLDCTEPPELTRFSKLRRLLRVTAWMRRWITSRDKEEREGSEKVLQQHELDAALLTWVRVSQRAAFAQELLNVREGRAVHPKSALKKLTPFLDQHGILRVGGRLKHAVLDVDQRHPIILASSSHLSQLLVEEHHLRTLHGGTQATLASIRQRFWILRGRQQVKSRIHRCPTCIRWRAATPQPIMANLPAERVTPSRPFLHTGVDFAGPIRLRTTKGRGHRAYKGFLSVFICFSSRAVHLEVVSDYTATAFLAAFRRFTSRRGLCEAVYSDCGTNFVGADAELRRMFSGAAPDAQHIAGHLASEGIRWVFNPPASPHFGGIWEAAVKSVKHHLRRVIGEATLTFEEMTTLLAEVEACLNSRPLQAMSDDPEDLFPLTPGHFLVGGPLNAIPEPSLLEVPTSRLTRWQLIERMRDHLWARWSREYIQSLTPRAKWWKTTGGLQEGQLCIIKGEQSAPTRWPLGRITQLHPGKDGQVRVVEVKTASGSLTRPVIKIIPLPGIDSVPDKAKP